MNWKKTWILGVGIILLVLSVYCFFTFRARNAVEMTHATIRDYLGLTIKDVDAKIGRSENNSDTEIEKWSSASLAVIKEDLKWFSSKEEKEYNKLGNSWDYFEVSGIRYSQLSVLAVATTAFESIIWASRAVAAPKEGEESREPTLFASIVEEAKALDVGEISYGYYCNKEKLEKILGSSPGQDPAKNALFGIDNGGALEGVPPNCKRILHDFALNLKEKVANPETGDYRRVIRAIQLVGLERKSKGEPFVLRGRTIFG